MDEIEAINNDFENPIIDREEIRDVFGIREVIDNVTVENTNQNDVEGNENRSDLTRTETNYTRNEQPGTIHFNEVTYTDKDDRVIEKIVTVTEGEDVTLSKTTNTYDGDVLTRSVTITTYDDENGLVVSDVFGII